MLNGDRVVVSKFAYGLFLPLRDHAEFSWGHPNVGDVVIIKSPVDGVDIIKRVIGIGGDFIEMRADRVYRNGEPLPATDVGPCASGSGSLQADCRVYSSKIGEHDFHISTAHISPDPFPTRVPEGSVYVLGDHRDHSADSRVFGPVPVDRVKGRAWNALFSWGPGGIRTDRIAHGVAH